MPEPQSPPNLNIPSSPNTVTVSIIDTTAKVGISTTGFMQPAIPGHDDLNAVCYSFLIKRNSPNDPTKYDTLLFDLGVRKDYENGPKVLLARLGKGVTIEVKKGVDEILEENGEDPKTVGGIIWSHWHFVSGEVPTSFKRREMLTTVSKDHTGDPSTFPTSTDLIVGPGFTKAFTPAFPTKEDSPVDERAWQDRKLVEIDFDSAGTPFKIGQYNAYDFYGDGSFYLLDTPGHAIGHMCGLARTKAEPAEFIFMGTYTSHLTKRRSSYCTRDPQSN